MNKLKTGVFLAILFFTFSIAKSQITFDAEYDHSGTFTQLALSGSKFYVMDVSTSQCRIYNMDYTLWKTISLSVPANHYLYDIKLISENLFTLDNSLALCYTYYTYDEVNLYYTYTTKVVKENGTELITIPGGQYAYAFSLPDDGTKFMVYAYNYGVYPYTIKTHIYSLPGEVYTSLVNDGYSVSAAGAHPNPAREFTTITYQLPAGETNGSLIISDMNGRRIAEYPLEENIGNIHIHTAQLPAGVYFYSLQAGNTKTEAKKLIVR